MSELTSWSDNIDFREAIKEYRENTGKTQEEFAVDMGISCQYQNDLENGNRRPSVKYVNRLCERHGCKPGSIGYCNWHVLGAKASGWDVKIRIQKITQPTSWRS